MDIKDSNFNGIRSFTKGGVIYASSESNQGLSIHITGNPAVSISKFTITESIFYDFIDLAVISIYIYDSWYNYINYEDYNDDFYYEDFENFYNGLNICCNCMKNY